MTDAASYLQELLLSAETPEQLQHAERMLVQLEAEQAQQNRWRCDSLKHVAEFFGVSLSTVKQWRQESPPMPGDETGYDLREVVAWRIAKQAASPLREEKQRQEIELGEIRKQQQQIELDKLRGSLVPLADVEEWASRIMIQFRESMMQIPQAVAQLAPVRSQRAIETQAEEYVRAALSILQQQLAEQVETNESEPKTDAQTESNPAPKRARKKAAKKPAAIRRKRNRPA
jgi:phage terminase Nu1 subunit (DNA packaging protein)